MQFSNPYLKGHEKLDLLARWIITHSMLYYEYDESLVPDAKFDSNAQQFLKLAKEVAEEERRQSRWLYVMRDFDGSTGYNLPKKLTNEHKGLIKRDIKNLLKQNKRGAK